MELFAGVGGFRLGLEAAGWQVVWSNQWEPGSRNQYASECYVSRFGRDGHVNCDISAVPAVDVPDHDLLVGGFPCQDYSVATTNAEGLHGKKGVLWWEIHRILKTKKPPYILLENVDRLLKSPTAQRGRDFGVMLWCLNDLGYCAEWRVLNAADYGAPQKRRRVFIVGSRRDARLFNALEREEDRQRWLRETGFFAKQFPVMRDGSRTLFPSECSFSLPSTLQVTSDRFDATFENSGVMLDGAIWTNPQRPRSETPVPLGSVLETRVSEEYYVSQSALARWKYLKGAKAEPRKAATGFEYAYSEGALPFPDPIDRPGRTVMTDEGGLTPSRFRHIIEDPATKQFRVLTPREVERMNQFPDDWTATGMPQRWRYFCMGNALVVGLVRRMGRQLAEAPVRPQGVRVAERVTTRA